LRAGSAPYCRILKDLTSKIGLKREDKMKSFSFILEVAKVIIMKKTPVIPASEPESRRFWTPGQARGDILGLLKPLLITCLIYGLTGCLFRITGSGDIVTVKKDFTDFDRIKISNMCSADIEYAGEYKVEIRIDDNITDRLVAEKENDLLKIGLARGNYRRITCEALITLPDIRQLIVVDAASSELSGFDLENELEIHVSDASRVTGRINTDELKIYLSDASSLNLEGSAHSLNISAMDASSADLTSFSTDIAYVHLIDASKAAVDVIDTLGFNVNDASTLTYYGSPVITEMNIGNASSVKKGD
jgi:hypothetical protein